MEGIGGKGKGVGVRASCLAEGGRGLLHAGYGLPGGGVRKSLPPRRPLPVPQHSRLRLLTSGSSSSWKASEGWVTPGRLHQQDGDQGGTAGPRMPHLDVQRQPHVRQLQEGVAVETHQRGLAGWGWGSDGGKCGKE